MYFDEILDNFKCGKKIRRTSWPTGVTISRNFDSIHIKDLLADDWEVVEEKNKNKRWEPKVNEQYFYIRSTGIVDYTNCDDDKVDKLLQSFGNCFQTEEQAEFILEKLKVIQELEKFAFENNNEEEIDWNDDGQKKFFLYYSYSANQVLVNYVISMNENPFNVYFTSESIAEKSVETIGEERIKKYYFGVKDE